MIGLVILISANQYEGLSADPKPTSGISIGATFYETDTGNLYIFNGAWIFKPPKITIADPASGNQASISAFHNTDNQAFGGTTYGLMTGGVAQLLNTAGNLDRQRETGVDGVAALGIATGTQQLASPFSTTSATSVTSGSTVITPAAMSGTNRGAAWSIQVGSVINCGAGASLETVIVTAVTATTFTATFTKAHSGTWNISGNVYNQARDATTPDGSTGQGFAAGATFLYNAGLNGGTGGWESERSAAGELDGASGSGTAIAAEYEWNAGGPLTNSGSISGLQYDRGRNLQGKGIGLTTLNGSVSAGVTTIILTAVAGLNPGQQIIIDRAGANPEAAYVSSNYTIGSTTVTLQSALAYAHNNSVTVEWDIFSALGPGINGFTAAGIGIEEEALYDPVSNKYYIERAATQDGVNAQNVVLENVALWDAIASNMRRMQAIPNTGVQVTPLSGNTSTAITTATTTTLKASAGVIGTISNAANATTGIITVYDNTVGSGKLVWVGTLAAGQVLQLGIPCTTGITVVTVGAQAILVSFA